MIPKVIHYCWFGRGEKPLLAQRCIASWKKHMPDYEIIEWNEDNFNVEMNAYTKMCYEEKRYAFLTDYLRLIVIEKQGGLYFDTDVEVLKTFDDLLEYSAFYGFENDNYVNTGEGFGSEAHHPILKAMITEYDCLLNGDKGTIGCPILNTQALTAFGLEKNGRMQQLGDTIILPEDFLNPRNSVTGEMKKTKNSHSIHWYSASWMPWYKRLRSKVLRPVHRITRMLRSK